MKNSIIVVSFLLLGLLANAYSPSISVKSSLPTVQTKTNEIFNADMSQYFTGYNISYSTNTANSTVQPPLATLATAQFGPSLLTDTPNIIFQAYPHDVTGNINYSGYILYLTDDAYLYWANITNYTSAPQMVFGFQVSNSKNVHCYGAAQINSELIIVDCAEYNATSNVQTDWFYYVSISKQAIVASFSNPATTQTTWNNQTGKAYRGVKTADYGNGVHFIFRYVGSDAIKLPNFKDDTYIEVYSALNWTQPQPVMIVSSGYLGAASLNLVGFQILNKSLYILDSTGILYNVQNFEVEFVMATINSFTFPSSYSLTGMNLAIEYYQTTPKLTVLVWANNLIWEIDYTIPTSPVIVQNYTFPSDITVVKAEYTFNYIIAHVQSPSIGASVVNFARGSSGFNQLYKSLAVANLPNAIWWGVDRAYDNVYLWDANATVVYNHHFQKSWLLFNSSNVGNGSVTVTATSFGSDGTNTSVTASFSYLVIDATDFKAYTNTPTINLTLDYPSPFSIALDDKVLGPDINYTVSGAAPFPSYSFQSYANLSVNLPSGFAPTAIFYHQIAPNASATGTFNWFIQADGNALYNFWCVDALNPATQTPSLNCTLTGTSTLTAQVTRLVAAPQYVAVITADAPSNVAFLQPNLTLIANISMGDPIINACADLVAIPSGTYIACSQTIAKRIVLMDANLPTTTQFVINRTNIPESSFPIFSPGELIVNKIHPDCLFVHNGVGVLVIDTVLVGSLGVVQVVSNIALPPAQLSPPNFDFLVNEESVLIFQYQGTQTLLQEYSLAADKLSPLFIKQYSQFFTYTFQASKTSHYSSAVTDRFFTIVKDDQQNPQLLAFEAAVRANGNYLHGFPLNFGTGAALLSGAHSAIINAEYVLVGNENGKFAAFAVYDQLTFSFDSYLKNANSITETSSFNLAASSSLQPDAPATVPFSVLTYNTNPPVTPGPKANDTNALNFINFTTNRTSFIFNPYDFFSGVVDTWTLTPESTNDTKKITLTVPIGPSSTAFSAALKVLDLTITSDYVFAQAQSTLFQLNASNFSSILNIIDMSVGAIVPKNQRCEGVLGDDGWIYTVSFCRDTVNNLGYWIIVSYLPSTPSVLPAIPTPFTTVGCMRNVGKFVLILENPNGQVINPGAKFHVYNFTNYANPTYVGYIGGSFFGATSFQVGRWDLVSLGTDYYRIYFADGRFGVRTCEWNATSGQFSNPLSINLLNNPAFQADNIPLTSIFLGISVLKFDATSNDTVIALTTDTYNSYMVKLSFSPAGISANLLTVYKKLSAATNLPKITKVATNYTYFAVASYNNNTDEGFVTIYNATSTDQASQIKVIPYQPAAENNIAFTFLTQGSAIKFWAYTPAAVARSYFAQSAGSVQEYTVTPFFSINVVPNSNITSKYVNLTGSNNHSSATVSFNITYKPSPMPGGSSKWWIWLIVIFALCIFAGGVYAFIQYRKKKQEEEVSVDANAPLTTNYA